MKQNAKNNYYINFLYNNIEIFYMLSLFSLSRCQVPAIVTLSNFMLTGIQPDSKMTIRC